MGADTSETRRASGKARGLTTGPEKALAAIRSIPGVLDAFYPDKGYLSLIRREEESILAAGGIGTRNEGLIRVMDRRHIIIAVTCPADMPFTVDEPTVELRTRDGELMGTNITESMRPAYEGRQDQIWLSDDFILFTSVMGDGTEEFVMPPVSFPHLGRSHGCSNAICCFPATSNSHMIMQDRGFSPSNTLATLIVGFDPCDRCDTAASGT